MKNNTLCIGATHGNERIGIDAIVLTLQKRNDFDWIVGNPRAFAKNIRFTEKDLNRCGKGNSDSNIYEERRAAEIQKIVQQYTYVFEIHGTYQDTGTFLLVTNPTKENLRLASFFDVDRLIIWPSLTPEMQYPISEFYPCGIEIEVGLQTDPKNTEVLANTLQTFLKNKSKYEKLSDTQWQDRLKQKTIYEMYGNIPNSIGITTDMLKEQTLFTWNDETFIPVFIGTYPYSAILGYKLRQLTSEQFLTKYI